MKILKLGGAGLVVFALATTAKAEAATETAKSEKSAEMPMKLSELCLKTLNQFKGPKNPPKAKSVVPLIQKACEKVVQLPECTSVRGTPIYHYERLGTHKANQRILVFSLIHGDEVPAGSVGRLWMERLEDIEPRNSWRVVPVLNPDGLALRTRTNANKVDVNRNFPTKDWVEKAQAYWKKDTHSNPRRFPGETAASEPETLCALKQIEDFKPDFVVSIHTPLKVLDFDGPRVKPPKFDYLPWRSLGHYPGSLGRYLWFERQTPVLTMELKEDVPKSAGPIVELQDVIGLLVSLEMENGKKLPASEPTRSADSAGAEKSTK